MTGAPVDREALWDAFLLRWPVDSLPDMTLAAYSTAGDKDCFTQWLESKTGPLGSVLGGSSFKFGVYSRKDQSTKPSGGGQRFNDTHAWLTKYGDTAEAAFTKVRSIIVKIAQAAAKGDMATVESADLGPVTKWKIAFLYQNRAEPKVLPIYKKESLQFVAGAGPGATCAELHAQLLSQRGGADLLTFGDSVLAKVREAEAAKLSTPQALAFFKSSDRFTAIKEPSAFMSGFRCQNGLEIALALDNKVVTLYLSQGAWLDAVAGQVKGVIKYAPQQSRTGSVGTFAPSLGVGHAAVKVNLESLGALQAVCDAYEGQEQPADLVEQSAGVDAQELAVMTKPPLNQILFGPPGTGKTYHAINAALEVLAPEFLATHAADREALRRKFAGFEKSGRVRFTTFHQSFSYEDFVEGIRAHAGSDDEDTARGLSYAVERGVFGQLCRDALRDKALETQVGIRDGARVWKLSIEEASGPGTTRQYCLDHGEARIAWADVGDLSKADFAQVGKLKGSRVQSSLENFSQNILVGDIVVCLASKSSISAVGVVSGEYEYTPSVPDGVRTGYVNKLPVHWLATGLDFNILALNQGVQLTQQTVYPLSRFTWPDLLSALTSAGVVLKGTTPTPGVAGEPYVLIIDEINRGSVSRIFGELITLIEPSKRAGAEEALEVVLPYSKQRFSVPSNVYIVGTMNTADRSLAGLDVALRRRFEFREMPPRPDLLDDVQVAGVRIGELLRVLNRRIEALLDREHCLGHAYFLPLKSDPVLARLASIFRQQILPLLQEYFFEDWQRIHWVLNDHRKADPAHRFLVAQSWSAKELFGDDVAVSGSRQSWGINDSAFDRPESYLGVIDATQVP